MWAAYPSGNPHGTCPLNRYFLFPSLNPGVQPNTAAEVVVEDFTAPMSPTDLTGEKAAGAVHLTWTAVEADTGGCLEVVDYYVIYRDTDPDSIGSEDSLGTASGTEYLDATAAVGNTGVNHYYAIAAVDEGGNKSSPSAVIGEFDKSLTNVK
jgi:hypothetical protein